MHAHADDGTSQWAVLRDPQGAAFGIVPVVPAGAIPADDGAVSEEAAPVGRIAWRDLTVADAAAARETVCVSSSEHRPASALPARLAEEQGGYVRQRLQSVQLVRRRGSGHGRPWRFSQTARTPAAA